jgi:hypothetical protein
MNKKVSRSSYISELDYRVKIGSKIFLDKEHFHGLMKSLTGSYYDKNEYELVWRDGYHRDGWLKCLVRLGGMGVTIEQLLKSVEEVFEEEDEIAKQIRQYHPDP